MTYNKQRQKRTRKSAPLLWALREKLTNGKFMDQIEIIKLLALPLSIIFAALWISNAISKLAQSLNSSPTDNYEIALRITKEIYSKESIQNQAERNKIEKEILETYERVLQKAEEIDYKENEPRSA